MGDGLSQASVMSIYQDDLGRMWFGTREGISVYDGEHMTVYKAWAEDGTQNHTDVLLGNECDFLNGNKKGDIFFHTYGGMMKYDIRKQTFSVVATNVRTLTSVKGEIWAVTNDSIYIYDSDTDSLRFHLKTGLPNINYILVADEELWIGTTSGLYLMEKGGKARCIIEGRDIYRIFRSSAKEVWVGCRMEGLYRISPDDKITFYSENSPPPNRLVTSQIREFVEDNYGNIWFGTFKGLYKYNPYTNEFILHERDQLPGSLSHSSVFSLYLDRQGTIWAGTYYGGVSYFNPESDVFAHYIDNPSREDCLNYPFVGHMVEDKNGNLWICTEGGGLNFMNRKDKTFRYYVAGKGNALSHDNLKSIAYDEKRDMLYLGTHTGGVSRYNIKTNEFYNYLDHPTGEDMPNDIIVGVVIYKDTLIVSARNGVFTLDLVTGKWNRFFEYSLNLMADSKGYLWLGLTNEVVRIKLSDPEDIRRFPNPRFPATCIVESRDGIYIGTLGSGLFRYNEKVDSFTPYTQASGHLLSNYCYDVAETNHGNLLITSDKGITFFNPSTKESKYVKLGSGLPITSITEGCGVLVCRNNELFVGGTDGLTSFWEEDLDMREKEYSIYFSDLYIHNEKIYPGDKTNILTETLPFTKDIHLRYNQNNLIVHFATNNYIDIQKSNEYEYILKGFNTEWIPTNLTSIYYTNLNPGKYELVVRERNLPANSIYNQGITLHITISPPWYNTIWAWIVYLLTTAIIVYIIIRTKNARRELALSLEKEREEKERGEELNQAKLRFFTNISHEFRTPLTLIISQIDLLFQSTALAPNVYNKIIKISKNANRMRSLITELLEFRKFEQNFVSLRVSEQNLIPFLKDIYLSFFELAAQQSITLKFEAGVEEIPLWYDSYQLQKVFYNLLSNAFKYTKKDGTVEITVEEDEYCVTVKIIDNGIGLSPEDTNRIFDRFYQAENGMKTSAANPGTGIGLALSKSIVELHHGSVDVQSQLGYGTIFHVRLLKGKEHFASDKQTVILEKPEEPLMEVNSLPDAITAEDYEDIAKMFPGKEEGSRYTVLIVEDNEELLQILSTLFAPLYKVYMARNGDEGFQIALAEKPDLIVSDVMMPVMTGTEMCMRIKNNIDLCHIPVVLLTALNTVEHNIEGLQQGADDYIGKPFHAKVLLMRCNNLIRNRLLMHKQLSKQVDFDVNLLAVNPLDQKLLDRVSEIIDLNIDNPEFDVALLAKGLAMGRSSLFSKFKALTGMTPNDYIQSYRLKKAAVLLRENLQIQIGEVSDRLGFSSSIYFSRCFKTQFGVSPAQFRKEGNKAAE